MRFDLAREVTIDLLGRSVERALVAPFSITITPRELPKCLLLIGQDPRFWYVHCLVTFPADLPSAAHQARNASSIGSARGGSKKQLLGMPFTQPALDLRL